MLLTDRDLLRLHIEAVWGVKLPPIEQNELTLLAESIRPDWRLCVADLAEGRIFIWRTDLARVERAELLARLAETQHLSPDAPLPPGISREVALRLVAEPTIGLAAARQCARPLSEADYPLLAAFQPGDTEDMLRPELRPLIGVINDGRLLCLAHSSRRTAEGCELGIDTLSQARRHGYALAATVVWSATIVAEGLTPLYSALSDNTASLGLAAAAGYRQFSQAITLV